MRFSTLCIYTCTFYVYANMLIFMSLLYICTYIHVHDIHIVLSTVPGT